LYERFVNPQRIAALRRSQTDRPYVRGEGCYLYDDRGERYLDCDGGYGVFAAGRNHPRVRQAMHDTLESCPPNMVSRDVPVLAGLVAEALARRMPEPGYRALFTNSGSETTEAALKFARRVTGKPRLLFLEGDFHGVTFGALSVTDTGESLRKMGAGLGPLLPGCDRIAWNDLQPLAAELARNDVAALIVEPIQGATLRSLSAGYLRGAVDLCHRHGAVFIADEILSGVGRTGAFLACGHAGIVPDMVLLSKALSGGCVPVGALLVRSELHARAYDSMSAFVHGSTFGENDFGLAAALTILQLLDEEDLIGNAARQGARLLDGLKTLGERFDMIAEVRGSGLLVGVELTAPRSWGTRISGAMLQRRGLLGHLMMMQLLTKHRILASTGARNNVLRFHPPLTIADADITHVLTSFESILQDTYRFPDGIGRFLVAQALRLAARGITSERHSDRSAMARS